MSGLLTHPSEFIQDELDERGWTLRDLVFRMRRYENEKEWAVNLLAWEMYMTVQDKDLLLGEEMSRDIGRAFGVSPYFFNNLHENWRKDQPGRTA
jgi:plasmid maintenance system antidote protein VapI